MKLKDGLNICTNREYHADQDYISSSSYKLLLSDLPKFHREKILKIVEPQAEKSYFVEGSYVHSLILEPEMIDEEYAIFPGNRKYGFEWSAFKEKNPTKQLLSASQLAKCTNYHQAYKDMEQHINLIQRGHPEHTICGTYCGIKTKVRCDYINVNEGYIVDVKTSASPIDRDSFQETIERYKYELSAALYLEMTEQYYNKSFDFYFVCIGKKDLTCETFKLSRESREKGKSQLAEAVLIYNKCLTSGTWDVNVNIEYNILEV